MLLSIRTYLLIAAVSLMLAICGYGYYAHGRIATLTQDVTTYEAAVKGAQKAKEDSDKSCIVTVDSLNGYYKDQQHISSSQEATGAAILTLPTLTIKEKANAAPTKPQSFADDDRLSPDLMQLLDTAYCYGDKDSCATPSK